MSVLDEFQSILENLRGDISDSALETLLHGMRLAFQISNSGLGHILGLEGYDRNIQEPFRAAYVFGTEDDRIQATARFHENEMFVDSDGAVNWDLKVSFRDVPAFWKFLFSGGNDIVECILANDVEVYGNVNHLHKFGFMAKDLLRRIGIA